MIVYLLVIGLISIMGQVVLLRELNVSFFGVELIYLIALGIWLCWTALGAVLGSRKHSLSARDISVLFILFGIIIPLDIVFIRASRLILGGIPGAYLSFSQQMMVAVISLLPAGLLSGLLFQWTAREYVSGDRTLAAAYAVESAGGLIGGLLSTLFIVWGVGNYSVALVCALFSIAAPLLVLKESKTIVRAAALILCCVLAAFLWKSSSTDRTMTGWNHPHLLESGDSPYGRITVTRLDDQISVFENDALSFETEGTEAEYFCHLAALQHPGPQTILILGGGVDGFVREARKYNPARIDYVELNPVMLNLTVNHLPSDIRESLQSPNVRVIFADPREYLKRSGTYDLVLVGMPEPSSGQANRFYTREFFEQCSAKLNTGGILAFRLRTAENLWSTPLARRNAGIYSALNSVFPEVLFLPGATNVVTASNAQLPRSPEVMSKRLQDLKIAMRLVSPAYIRYLFTNDRFSAVNDFLRKEKSPPNTDIRPVCYQYAFVIWLSKFFPRLGTVDPASILNKGFFKPPLIFLWIGLPVFFLLARLQPMFKRGLLVASAGFLGMVLETVLILTYQIKYGVLYQNVGLLLMGFMAGLALGAVTMNSRIFREKSTRKISRWTGPGLVFAFCCLSAFMGVVIKTNVSIGLMGISFLLVLTGFLVSGIFAYASLYEIEDQKKMISPLYSADLLGGSLGSLIGSIILIPLAGMDATSLAMATLAALSILLI